MKSDDLRNDDKLQNAIDNQDVRWKQRFHNFNRAFTLLRSAVEERSIDGLSELEQEGLIQRFEYTFELAWKTMKDYLMDHGVVLREITPRAVIKESVTAGIIQNGQPFIDMMLARNMLSHCYDFERFRDVLGQLSPVYLPALESLYDFFLYRINDDE
jgi:nucleotidyltransferase substrate binding protein (TIGR01987 family)